MRILIVTSVYYPDIIGGGEYSLKMLAEGLAARGHRITIICLGEESGGEDINNVHVIRHYIKGISESELSRTRNHPELTDPLSKIDKIRYRIADLFYNKAMYTYYKTIIKEGKYEAIQSATALNFMGRYNLWKAGDDLGIPVSHVARSPQLLKIDILNGMLDPLYTKIVSRGCKFLTAFTAPSQYMIDRHKSVHIAASIMYPIYNAVDIEMTSCSTELIKNKENIILYAGDLRKEKGIYTLKKAFLLLKGDVRLYYIGSGEEYKSLACDGNKINVIKWMNKEDLYNLMKKAKIVVLPSEWEEAFGRTIIEGIFNGTISIGSDSGGIPEVLNNDSRYIFKSGDHIDLFDRMNRILKLSNKEYLDELSFQQKQMNRFTYDKYLDEWECFFEKQIAKEAE